jgi:hypothetical protein
MLDKLFVEPVPMLFRLLSRNTKAMSRVIGVRAAVSPTLSGNATLYCLGLNGDSANIGGTASVELAPELVEASGPNWWSEICSLSRSRLSHPYDVGKLASPDQVGTLIKELNVPSITPKELLLELAPSPVRYVQIDVEGLDDQLLRDLPWTAPGFSPAVIVFEIVLIGRRRTEAAVSTLRHHGYTCCIGQDGMNIIATRF